MCCFAGNPWPPVVPHKHDVKNSLINVLLNAARWDYRKEQEEKNAKENSDSSTPSTDSSGEQGASAGSIDSISTEEVTQSMDKLSVDSSQQQGTPV